MGLQCKGGLGKFGLIECLKYVLRQSVDLKNATNLS